jgi:hypothetical protein
MPAAYYELLLGAIGVSLLMLPWMLEEKHSGWRWQEWSMLVPFPLAMGLVFPTLVADGGRKPDQPK